MANDAPGNVTAAKNIRQIVVTAPGPQGASGLSGIQSSEIPTLVSYAHNQLTILLSAPQSGKAYLS